jgi:hypothetical protein
LSASVTRLEAAVVGAVTASLGDIGLLWVAWAADGRLGVPAPPGGTLIVGHYAGIIGIPLYALGYAALADGVRAAAPGAAGWIARLGFVGAVVGAVVHGLTGTLTAVAIRTGAPTAPDALPAMPEAMLLLPLWGIVIGVSTIGSVMFATVVARGGTCFPRWFAACNPLVVTIALAAASAPLPTAAAFVAPAAPNLAHVVVFMAAMAAWRGDLRRS